MVDEFNSANYSKEVIKNVFEINPDYDLVHRSFLNKTEKKLSNYFSQCQNWAASHDYQAGFIGIPPHLPISYFNESLIADLNRYHILNDRLIELRCGQPWLIDIKNKEHLQFKTHDICLEGLTTSTQFHLKVPFTDLTSIYNYSQLISPFMVAVGANSPFIDSNSLWHESRIPLFHQTVCEQQKVDEFGCADDRVRFGNKFINSITDLFDENIKLSEILPQNKSLDFDEFACTKLHNSTIWRWNRLVFSSPEINPTHIRLEHRTQSAGTSPADITAQLAFFVGMIAYWHKFQPDICDKVDFKILRHDFYSAAQYGLCTTIRSIDNSEHVIQKILLTKMLSQAADGLKYLEIADNDIEYYINIVLRKRIEKNLSGASWQISKAQELGSVAKMFSLYLNNQQLLKPLYLWD